MVDDVEISDCNGYVKIVSPQASKAFYVPLYTRWDIGSMYDDPRASNCGFRIQVPKSEMAGDGYSIKIAVRRPQDRDETLEPVRAWTRSR